MHNLKELQEKIKQGISEINFNQDPSELYEPIEYVMNLGGKRMRPALCLLACDFFGGDINKAIDPALGIEIFHNFTLLHDDIMDQAPLRRGKPSVHLKWNPNIAILSGDTMMAISYDYIMKAPEKMRMEVINVFNKTAIEVCEGQQYDMNFENLSDVTIPDYINMIRLKTAVLLAGSLKIGALIGGAKPEDAEKLFGFGENIGIAFQLKDDLLDVFSDKEKFGKVSGGDILANKKTFLYLKAFELADGKIFESLWYYFNKEFESGTEKIKGVKNIYNSLEINNHTEKEIEKYYQAGLKYLDEIDIEEERKSELRKFAALLNQREN